MTNWIQRNISLLILIAITIATIIIGYLYFRPHAITNKNTFILTIKKDSANSINYSVPEIQYVNQENNNKLGTLLGGLFAGFIIALIQYLILLDEKRKLDAIKALKVRNVLFDRADEGYYRMLIKKSKIKIRVMGVTAFRLLQDFADTESLSPDRKIILDALNRNVNIRILLPTQENLSSDSERNNFASAKTKMAAIHLTYPKNFNFKYFDHTPAHSIFNVDDETIIGPVIPGMSSKDTPGIHVLNSSKYAETYLNYFENEWSTALNN